MYLDVGSVERAIKAIESFDKRVKRMAAKVKYVAIYSKVCSGMDEHPGYCVDKLFSDVRTDDIDLRVEERLVDARKSIEAGRAVDMMNARSFELVGAFPAHYYEDGIHHVEAALIARQA